jgi:CheY-like chemotaxis protein
VQGVYLNPQLSQCTLRLHPEGFDSVTTKTVLLLDDNASATFVLRSVMEFNGYSVLESSSPEQAILVAAEHPGPIDLLISDVILGTTSGAESLRRIRELRPGLPVLFVSGYPLQELLHRELLDGEEMASTRTAFLQKPFTAGALMSSVRQLLDRTQ